MSSGFASPRPWSKTPSKSRLGMMSRTPSKAELEAEKKTRKGEKVFSLTGGKDKAKKTGLKEKAAVKMKAQQKLQEAQRRKDEEERRQQQEQRQEEERRRQREEQERRQREMEEEQQRLAAMAQAKTPSRPVPVSDGYEMTPQGEDKWAMNPSSANNYNIDDLDSGDETDDDENP